jgi:two-component system OmpR family sensor kinase
MDGFKKHLNTSVQRKLSISLTIAILAVALIAGVFSFVSALDEAHELQDDTLRQLAVLLDQPQFHLGQLREEGPLNEGDAESQVIIQYLSAHHAPSAAGGAPLPIPATLGEGLYTLDIHHEPFRVLVRKLRNGERIAVAQETDIRDEIARDSALRTVMPFLILMPILLWVVANLVRKLFRPIAVLSAEIDRRDENDLYPIDDRHLPSEVRPFVRAINRLLARVAQSLEHQRRFVADAAHELRSPLTAMSLQAERLAEAELAPPVRERLTVLQRGIERGRNLLDQLLTLARAQAAGSMPDAPVSLRAVFTRVLEDLMPLAEAKQIDIGVEGSEDARVEASELDLIAMVKNLVDNAIRYTPAGGRVDLSIVRHGTRALLSVRDSGPGIPPAERARVFDPFYRALGSEQVGSGLGLSIVHTIAERLGAEIRLGDTDTVRHCGLAVEIELPLRDRPDGEAPAA